MLYTQTTHEDMRDLFCKAISDIFGDSLIFLDILENDKYSSRYNCYLDPDGENYIINSETGEYINWYKLYHLGRCISISTSSIHTNISKWFNDFLVDFKMSVDKEADND